MDKVTDFHYTSLPDDSPYVKPFRMYYVQNGKEKSWDLLKVHDSVSIIILNKTRNNLVFVKQFRPGTPVSLAHCFASHKIDIYIHVNSRGWHGIINKAILTFRSISAVYHSILSSDPLHHLASPQVLLEKYPVSLAITTELCAGIVDKTKTLIEIAQEEVLEECGYNVPVERIELVMTYRQVLHNCNLHSYSYRSLLLIEVDYTTNEMIWTALLFHRAGVGTNGSMQTLYYVEVTDDDKAAEGGGVDDEIIDVLELTPDQCRNMLQQGAVNNAPPSCLLGISWFLTNKFNQWIQWKPPKKKSSTLNYVFQNFYEKNKFQRCNATHVEFSDKFAI